MIFKRKIAKTKIKQVTITEFVNEFCDRFSKTHYISIDVSTNGTVYLFLGGLRRTDSGNTGGRAMNVELVEEVNKNETRRTQNRC